MSHNEKKVGERHSISEGYIEVKTPRGWRVEHRYIAEMMLGRELETDEVIHHKNGDKKDNRWKNLEVISNKKHSEHHGEEQEKEYAVLECPECGSEFERCKKQTLISKPEQKATFCEKECAARYYAKGKNMNREQGMKKVKRIYKK